MADFIIAAGVYLMALAIGFVGGIIFSEGQR